MSNALEVITLLFLVILGLLALVLLVYAVFMVLRKFPKFLKARKISWGSSKEEILYYSENKEVKKAYCGIHQSYVKN